MGGCCETPRSQSLQVQSNTKNPIHFYSNNQFQFEEEYTDSRRIRNTKIIEAVIKGDLHKLQGLLRSAGAYLSKIEIEAIRGYQGQKLLKLPRVVNQEMLNPIMIAVLYSRLDILKSLIEGKNYNISLMNNTLKNELQERKINSFPNYGHELPLIFVCMNKDIHMLDYLLNSLYHVWNLTDIHNLTKCVIKDQWNEGLEILLNSEALKSLTFTENIEEQVLIIDQYIITPILKYPNYQSKIHQIMEMLLKSGYSQPLISLIIKQEKHGFDFKLLEKCCLQTTTYQIVENQSYYTNLRNELLQVCSNKGIAPFLEHIQNSLNEKSVHQVSINAEIFNYIKEGQTKKVIDTIEQYQIKEVSQIRDNNLEVITYYEEKITLMDLLDTYNQKDLAKINAFQLALFYSRIDIVQYFINKMKINIKKAIQNPITISNTSFILKLALKQSKHKRFLYFWEEHPYLFDDRDLKEAVCFLIQHENLNFLQTLLYSRNSKAIFMNLPFKKRNDFIEQVFTHQPQPVVPNNHSFLITDEEAVTPKGLSFFTKRQRNRTCDTSLTSRISTEFSVINFNDTCQITKDKQNDQESFTNDLSVIELTNQLSSSSSTSVGKSSSIQENQVMQSFCKQPYSLQALLYSFEQQNPTIFKKALRELTDYDIDDLLQIIPTKAYKMCHLQETEFTRQIHLELLALTHQIQVHPLYQQVVRNMNQSQSSSNNQ